MEREKPKQFSSKRYWTEFRGTAWEKHSLVQIGGYFA